MIEVTVEFKNRVAEAMLDLRKNYPGSEEKYAKTFGLNKSIYSRIKNGERDKIVSGAMWVEIGQKLDVLPEERKWNMARTEVFDIIEEDILYCKMSGRGKIFADYCAIGKTYSAKYLSQRIENCFYVDASQSKSKYAFARALAKCVGANSNGTYEQTKANIKGFLRAGGKSVMVVDEAGDLRKDAFEDLKEYMNATEYICGWYLMGADGLEARIESGIRGRKQSYRELFSRLSDRYSFAVPKKLNERISFYRNLITTVLTANMKDINKDVLNRIVNRCLDTEAQEGEATGLRRAEGLLMLWKMGQQI
jgi:hypothetical protein